LPVSALPLTPRLVAAVQDETAGATGVTRQVIDGLLELTDDRDRLRATTDLLAVHLPWCAPMWQVRHAVRQDDPAPALRALRERLDFDVDRSVAAAVKLLAEWGCAVRTAPGSALVTAGRAALSGPHDPAVTVGLVGADAVGPDAMLNVVGTAELTTEVPTVIVATSVKLVPEEAVRTLGGAGFEWVPLARFHTVVLDGELLTPAEAGQRAAALG
jgi:hypothetical protein